jgi:hypothetical protein
MCYPYQMTVKSSSYKRKCLGTLKVEDSTMCFLLLSVSQPGFM